MISVVDASCNKRKWRPKRFVILLAIMCSLAGCNDEPTEAQVKSLQCAKNRYADFNPKNMQQCVDACIVCDKGSVTTCTTACTLKGAK
jgi:hypothetical protein